MSDIDITFFTKQSIDPAREIALANKYTWLKNKIPVIGEANYYKENEDIPFHLANPFELERDPKLLDQIRLNSKKDKALRFVYVLRILRSDLKYLNHDFNLRKKKWVWHYKQLEINAIPTESEFLNTLKTEICLLSLRSDFVDVVKCFSSNLENSWKRYHENRKYLKTYILCFFTDWLQNSNTYNYFERDLNLLKGLSEQEKVTVQYHVHWEIFSLHAQYLFLENYDDLIFHLLCLEKVIETLSFENKNQLFREIDSIREKSRNKLILENK